MTAERWQQVKEIFQDAVDCPPEGRAAFLRARCGSDEKLLGEVESLLDSDEQGGSVLDRALIGPAGAPALPSTSISEATLILNDRYEVERELGRGGMSVVYLARDRQLLAKRVVVKVLLEETNVDPWIRQKFQQEMEALARIDHPGVVGVLDTGLTAEGNQFLVMQYIEGDTLRHVLDPGGINFKRAAGLLRQIGQALSAAHEKGVWHRDLKPENIMLQRLGGEEHVKLIDFGIAGIQNSQFGGEKSKVAGTLTYMAPEQFAGHPCAASDTYALGVVAYEMLTGKKPFSPHSMSHLVKERQTQWEPPRQLRPELTEAAERSIRKAMSFRPDARQATVREFSEELSQALTGTWTGETTRKPTISSTVEIAHVLFADLVGYSLLPMDQQKDYLAELQQIVRESPQFRAAEAAGDVISLPTGDGMALAFFVDPTAPAQCALEIAAGLKSTPHLKLRMGIHSGPVYRVADMNANANVAGGGINMAQRVMDCGDAGHILLSKSVAEVLMQLSQWSPYLTDLGECTVKHGVKVHLSNLATPEVGNPKRPTKLVAAVPERKSKIPLVAALMSVAVLMGAGAFWLARDAKSSGSQYQESIAVLPFLDLSAEKNQAYFSDGLAEELRDALAKIPGLRVAASTSSFQFRDKTDDARAIGKKLHVASILEGSVRKQGKRTKITTQLIKSADGFQLWSNTFDRDMTDIFAVQEEIARAVTGTLKIKLLGQKTSTPKSTNPEAYNQFLQGRYFLERRSSENLARAGGYFEEAIKLDKSYARAWAGLAESRNGQAGDGRPDSMQVFALARAAAQQALSLDDHLAEAHAAMAWIQQNADGNWAAADASYKKARELDPGNAVVLSHAAIIARILGHLDEAMDLDRQALQLDPLRAGGYYNAGVNLYYAGRDDEAAAAFQKVLQLVPGFGMAHCWLGRVYLAQSRPREALDEMEKEIHPALRIFGPTLAYYALGRKQESDASLAQFLSKFPNAAIQIAQMYAFRGETERAFEYLERAKSEQMRGDPLLKKIEHDPRYATLLKNMGLPL